MADVHLFHYHLVTSQIRELEARYVGKLGFRLLARYGRIGDDHVTIEPGTGWDELDRTGFKLRLSELQQGAVNVVLQPGHWLVPRIDHFGVMLDEDNFHDLVERATSWNLPVQERGSRRTFVSTNTGYRIEVHPPRDWIEELLDKRDELEVAELQLRTDRPEHQASILADILGVGVDLTSVVVGATLVGFLPGGPEGRPELRAERFS
jgi:hypothetical protein